MRISKFILLAFALAVSGCREDALLSELDQNQANEVVALLQKHNIDASKKSIAKSGYSVYVDKGDFSTAVDMITIYNLPSKPRIEIEKMFPADALISSPRAEIARIYSAIEQRLEQTLNQLNGVITSRVHVSYDINNSEVDNKIKPMHVAVLLRFNTGNKQAETLIADATRLVKNSFTNIEYENISVITTIAPEIWQQPLTSVNKFTRISTPWLVTGFILLALTFLFLFKRRLYSFYCKLF